MRNIKKQGFTLVELIVVITILAILGSIAFISLQGYSSDARNSKRSSDLSSIQSSLSTKQTQGSSLSSFVKVVTGNQLTAPFIAGTAVATGTLYNAGEINYDALGMKTADFQDPQSNSPYVMGYTTLVGGKYELAASIEQGGGAKVAKVVGNWSPRGTTLLAISESGTTLVLTNATDINKIQVGDTITNGTSTGLVNRVSADGLTLTVSSSLTGTGVGLAATESTALIDGNNATTGNGDVIDGGTILPY
nr:type II secretion system protein [Candidatus Gracilibacteria bacterium]